MAIVIYASLFLSTIVYALVLERVHDLYTPDFVWVTVVIGNAMIGLALLALCLIGELPMTAFWHLFGLNMCAGSVIVSWQIWQAIRRSREGR